MEGNGLVRIKAENALMILIVALGLGVRLLNLGAQPLSDTEASWALQALGIARGEAPALGPQPAYTFLTAITFFLFGSANALARLWPALVGTLLVVVPFIFHPWLGRRAAFILALALALDPALVNASRQAGTPILAAGFGWFALGLWFNHRAVPAGVFAGLALLSGPAIFQGLLIFGLAWLLVRRRPAPVLTVDGTSLEYRRAGLALLLTLLFAGSLFWRVPQGLGAWAASLPAYLAGWVAPDGASFWRVLAAPLIYQPLGLIFAALAAGLAWSGRLMSEEADRATVGQILSLGLAIALLVTLANPSRQGVDLVFALPLLWALAALGLASQMEGRSELPVVSLGEAVLLIILLILTWINLAALSGAIPGEQTYLLRLGLLGGVIGLSALTVVLVSLGWSWDAARRGLVWGIGVALALVGVSSMVRVSHFHPVGDPGVQEVWNQPPLTADADLLRRTLGDISNWRTGRRDAIDVTVQVDAPSLRWVLRDFTNARFVLPGEPLSAGEAQEGQGLVQTSLAQAGSPSIVITRQNQETPSLAATYRGEAFAWWVAPGWTGAFPEDWLRWLAFRDAPLQYDQLILWARSDLFPGGASTLEEGAGSLDDSLEEPLDPGLNP